jgi:hypothetical protein
MCDGFGLYKFPQPYVFALLGFEDDWNMQSCFPCREKDKVDDREDPNSGYLNKL